MFVTWGNMVEGGGGGSGACVPVYGMQVNFIAGLDLSIAGMSY